MVINSHGTTNFTFPFHVEFDASKDEEQNMLFDISQRCGLTGGEQKDLVVNYMLTPTIRVIGFPVSAVIKDTVQVPCPPLGMLYIYIYIYIYITENIINDTIILIYFF